MRKKRIIIIIICVFLLTVTALTVYRGLKMDPELAAVAYMGGAAPAGEPEEETGDSDTEPPAADSNTEPPAAEPDTNSASAEPFAESGVIGEGLIGDGYY